MSFAWQVKTELCSIRTSRCCSFSECYGMMLFAKRFSSACISLQTENIDVADLFARLCRECFEARTRITQGGNKRDTYIVSVISPIDRKKIMLSCGCTDGKRPSGINFELIGKECCTGSFIRGAFLSCGGVSDPNKAYHAQFLVKDKLLAHNLYQLLGKCGIPPKTYIRGESVMLYYKESHLIEDLFTTVNATRNTLALMDLEVMKTVKNKLNRQGNCMMANLDKTVEASVKQRTAIQLLKEKGILESLAKELQEAALLRTENPDSSLSELCQLSCEPITKSALSRRLTKIIELADKISKDE